jgi:hypothetical protein
VNRFSLSTLLALAASLGGIPLYLLWWDLVGGSSEYFAVSCVMYGWAAFFAMLGMAFPSIRPWLLMVGVLSIALWAFAGTIGSVDVTPLVPLAVYSTAIVLALNERFNRPRAPSNPALP